MGKHWEVPRIWDGETVAIFASGPSMTREVAERVRGRAKVIVINDQFELAPWADLLYACDAKWWNSKLARATCEGNNPYAFKGIKVTMMAVPGRVAPGEELLHVYQSGTVGIDLTPGYLRTGRNSGHQAINLAIQLGVANIILCGYDMRVVGGREHNFGSHPVNIAEPRGIPFSDFITNMTRSAQEVERLVRIVNTTKDSALKCYKYMDLEKALESMSTDKNYALLST